jgi:hypothetical protein
LDEFSIHWAGIEAVEIIACRSSAFERMADRLLHVLPSVRQLGALVASQYALSAVCEII